jgi:hypothetical protein
MFLTALFYLAWVASIFGLSFLLFDGSECRLAYSSLAGWWAGMYFCALEGPSLRLIVPSLIVYVGFSFISIILLGESVFVLGQDGLGLLPRIFVLLLQGIVFASPIGLNCLIVNCRFRILGRSRGIEK